MAYLGDLELRFKVGGIETLSEKLKMTQDQLGSYITKVSKMADQALAADEKRIASEQKVADNAHRQALRVVEAVKQANEAKVREAAAAADKQSTLIQQQIQKEEAERQRYIAKVSRMADQAIAADEKAARGRAARTRKVMQAARQEVAAEKQALDQEAEKQRIENRAVAVTLEVEKAAENYKRTVAGLNIMLKQGAITQQQYNASMMQAKNTFNASAAGMAKMSVHGKKGGMILQQLSFGAQDAIVSFGVGGLAGAMRGASNNLAQAASIMGPMTGAIAGLGVTIGAMLLPVLWDWMTATEDTEEKLKKLKGEVEKLSDAAERAGDHIRRSLEFNRFYRDLKTMKDLVSLMERIDDSKVEARAIGAEKEGKMDARDLIRDQMRKMRAEDGTDTKEYRELKREEARIQAEINKLVQEEADALFKRQKMEDAVTDVAERQANKMGRDADQKTQGLLGNFLTPLEKVAAKAKKQEQLADAIAISRDREAKSLEDAADAALEMGDATRAAALRAKAGQVRADATKEYQTSIKAIKKAENEELKKINEKFLKDQEKVFDKQIREKEKELKEITSMTSAIDETAGAIMGINDQFDELEAMAGGDPAIIAALKDARKEALDEAGKGDREAFEGTKEAASFARSLQESLLSVDPQKELTQVQKDALSVLTAMEKTSTKQLEAIKNQKLGLRGGSGGGGGGP